MVNPAKRAGMLRKTSHIALSGFLDRLIKFLPPGPLKKLKTQLSASVKNLSIET